MKIKITESGAYKLKDGDTVVFSRIEVTGDNCLLMEIDGQTIVGPPGSGDNIDKIELDVSEYTVQ